MAYQNLWDTVKAVFRGEFIALNAYIMKDQRPKTSMPSFHLRKLEKEEPVKSKVNMRKEIKIRGETNEIGNKTKSWFFENINKMDKSSARLTKKKREKTQIIKISNKREGINSDLIEIKMIIRNATEDPTPTN